MAIELSAKLSGFTIYLKRGAVHEFRDVEVLEDDDIRVTFKQTAVKLGRVDPVETYVTFLKEDIAGVGREV